eukprot:5529299-Heterocapsa_arctica.AAC.1
MKKRPKVGLSSVRDEPRDGGGKLYKWIREGTKAFGLPRCHPDWEGKRTQTTENQPGLASRQAAIEKTRWNMWDPGGVGGLRGHSNGVEHNFKEWAQELRNLGPFPELEDRSLH